MMIDAFFNRVAVTVVTVVLIVDSGAVFSQSQSGTAENQRVQEAPADTDVPPASLSADIIYNILAGEIAIQRNDLGQAYKHQLKGAELAHDAVAAERAARIALQQKDQAGGLVAVKRWIDFDPESPVARRIAVMLYMQAGDFEMALKHLKVSVELQDKDIKDRFVQAVIAVGAGEDKELALRLMQSLALDYQSDADARYALALTAVMAKKLDVAEKEIRQAINIEPKMENAYMLLGRIYMEKKDSAGAMRAMQKALKQSPKSKALRSSYARLLIDLDKPELAYQQFKELSKLAPEDEDVRFSLGIIALQLKKEKQAASYFDALLPSKKRGMDAAYYLGRIAEKGGKAKSALEWYGRVKNGNYAFDAQARSTALLADQGKLEQARAIIAKMRASMPNRSVDLYLLEGDILRKHSTSDKVVELYNAALKDHPEDLDLLYVRALSASALGKVDVLEKDIRFILKHKPDYADAWNALGYTLADQTDRYQEALGYIQKALALKPESPAILDSMGWVQYRLGNHKEAIRYLRRAFDMLQDVEIAAHLGELLWVTGDKQEAQKIMRGALKKHPENKYLLQAIKRLGI